jgi:peroxiredoxin
VRTRPSLGRRSFLVAGSAALFPFACASAQLPPSRSGQYVGAPLPAFSGVTVNGSEFDSNSSRGMVLLVQFFECDGGSHSLAEAGELYASKRELVIVGVSLDESLERTRVFAAHQGVKFPVLCDQGRTVSARLGVTEPGTSLAVDRRGILRWIGDSATPGAVEQAAAALLGESG